MLFLGKNINFDFEVDKNALVTHLSCGAWLNGDYYIVTTNDLKEETNGPIVRTVENLSLYRMNQININRQCW